MSRFYAASNARPTNCTFSVNIAYFSVSFGLYVCLYMTEAWNLEPCWVSVPSDAGAED